MQKPRISAIVALNQARAIGIHNDLIWRIPDDLKRFKALTTGHPIIMGRKTFESIGRPLPNRTNIIVTRRPHRESADVHSLVVTASSVPEALDKAAAADREEVFIIGGGEIFAQSLSLTDRLYLTVVKSDAAGDVFFPDYSEFTKVISRETHEWNGLVYEWLTLERNSS